MSSRPPPSILHKAQVGLLHRGRRPPGILNMTQQLWSVASKFINTLSLLAVFCRTPNFPSTIPGPVKIASPSLKQGLPCGAKLLSVWTPPTWAVCCANSAAAELQMSGGRAQAPPPGPPGDVCRGMFPPLATPPAPGPGSILPIPLLNLRLPSNPCSPFFSLPALMRTSLNVTGQPGMGE